eukprot:CAMPEP_0179916410 /NCGR_PEP_ID=MMETSP0983-20121128/2235_1 /TAXON_ID=483367 /ORGANISM="non described non described, Strain CCMP 2436" /LENGTH=92 /DNA_ID=CAMNT_0021818977 /DNA_START=1295 /DNA_END=1571 /DNA_ORIENTATION=-
MTASEQGKAQRPCVQAPWCVFTASAAAQSSPLHGVQVHVRVRAPMYCVTTFCQLEKYVRVQPAYRVARRSTQEGARALASAYVLQYDMSASW